MVGCTCEIVRVTVVGCKCDIARVTVVGCKCDIVRVIVVGCKCVIVRVSVDCCKCYGKSATYVWCKCDVVRDCVIESDCCRLCSTLITMTFLKGCVKKHGKPGPWIRLALVRCGILGRHIPLPQTRGTNELCELDTKELSCQIVCY